MANIPGGIEKGGAKVSKTLFLHVKVTFLRLSELIGVSLTDLWKSSSINGLQAASKVFILK